MAVIGGWLAWLGATPWSVALRESLWAYPIIETVHVLGVALFVGLAILVDLRLLGVVLRQVRVTDAVDRLGTFIWIGFAAMLSTGVALFAADPVKFAANPWFQAKVALLAVAGLNAAIFHATVYRGVAAWDGEPRPPLRARVAGAVSLGVWTAVIAAGRLIAFHQS